MELRIHHFYDIIRDFGSGKDIKPHPYGHSYYKVAELIRKNPNLQIKIVVGADAVCEGCKFLKDGKCLDKITHRKDFTSKEDFNNYLDKRIIKVSSFNEGDVLTPVELCKKAKSYLEKIEWVYEGNDPEHTEKRKENFINGLKDYSELHGFDLHFL